VTSARSNLGSVQNRFESVVANLSTTSENLQAAKGRIMDADFAVETSNMSRAQVLQQAGNAMLAQANQAPQQVMSLLR
jgi:flagellin